MAAKHGVAATRLIQRRFKARCLQRRHPGAPLAVQHRPLRVTQRQRRSARRHAGPAAQLFRQCRAGAVVRTHAAVSDAAGTGRRRRRHRRSRAVIACFGPTAARRAAGAPAARLRGSRRRQHRGLRDVGPPVGRRLVERRLHAGQHWRQLVGPPLLHLPQAGHHATNL